jgi:two-component system chemotaxis response regulator CheY
MQHLPDLVILDHRMPQMSGVDALPQIKRMAPKALIVFASADPSVEAEARRMGSATFLNKPFPMDQLISEINRLVEGSGNFPVHIAGTSPA